METEITIEQALNQVTGTRRYQKKLGAAVVPLWGLWTFVATYLRLTALPECVAFSAGILLGAFVLCSLSARHGRHRLLRLSQGLAACAMLLTVFRLPFWLHLLAFSFSGLGAGGATACGYLLLMESLAMSSRRLLGVLSFCACSIGTMIGQGVSTFDRPATLVCGLVAFKAMLSACLASRVFEAPAWLISQRKFDEARRVLSQIAAINSTEEVSAVFEGEQTEPAAPPRVYGFIGLAPFSRVLSLLAFVGFVVAFGCGVATDVQLVLVTAKPVIMLANLSAVLAMVPVYRLLTRVSKRLIVSLLLCGLSLTLATAAVLAKIDCVNSCQIVEHLTVAVVVLSRICSLGILATVHLGVAEYLPTDIRSSGFAILQVAVKSGLLVATVVSEGEVTLWAVTVVVLGHLVYTTCSYCLQKKGEKQTEEQNTTRQDIKHTYKTIL